MAGLSWYKRDPVAFLNGTIGLTLEEKGAYSILLDLIYAHGGPIMDNPQWIAGNCGCSVRRWNVIKNTLIERGKITAENGFISNSRASFELEKLGKSGDNPRTLRDKNGENEPVSNDANNLTPETRARVHAPEDKIREDKRRKSPPTVPQGGFDLGDTPPVKKLGRVKQTKTRCPDDFTPDDRSLEHGRSLGLTDDETRGEGVRRHLDYWHSANAVDEGLKADWQQTFRNGLDREARGIIARRQASAGGYGLRPSGNRAADNSIVGAGALALAAVRQRKQSREGGGSGDVPVQGMDPEGRRKSPASLGWLGDGPGTSETDGRGGSGAPVDFVEAEYDDA